MHAGSRPGKASVNFPHASVTVDEYRRRICQHGTKRRQGIASLGLVRYTGHQRVVLYAKLRAELANLLGGAFCILEMFIHECHDFQTLIAILPVKGR